MNQLIVKKNQQTENFSRLKLANSIQAALEASGEPAARLGQLLEAIESYLNIFLLSQNNILSTDIVRALTFKVLQENGLEKTAESYQNFQKTAAEKNSEFNKSQIVAINEYYLAEPKRDLNTLIQKISETARTANFDLWESFAGRTLIFPAVLLKKRFFDQSTIVLEDDLGSIFSSLKDLAINNQNQISTTIDFSRLRPKNSLIVSTQGKSAGPVSFIKIFLSSLEALGQNKSPAEFGITHQIVLSVDHPDILEYLILIKNQQAYSNLSHFQFLIRLNQQFLETLFKTGDFELINPVNHEISNVLSSSNLFDLLISTLQENPNFGLIRESDLPVETTNYLNFHLNLSNFVRNQQFQNPELEKILSALQKFPANNSRLRINLHGLAELFHQLDLVYCSVQTLEFANQLIELLGKFPELSFSCQKNPLIENLWNVTPGIEPFLELIKIKSTIDGSEHIEILPSLEQTLIARRLFQEPVLRQIAAYNSLSSLNELPENERNLFQTNRDIPPTYQLQIKQLFEEKLQSPFPKIISFPKNFSHEEIKELLISNLKSNLQSLSLLQFEENEDKNLDTTFLDQKKFLLSLHQKKRKARQIQPPLFQIKKTEEVILPPISSSHDA